MQGYENVTIANTAVTYSGDWGRFQSVAIWTEDIGGSAILAFTGRYQSYAVSKHACGSS